jgi:hypothetical protein
MESHSEKYKSEVENCPKNMFEVWEDLEYDYKISWAVKTPYGILRYRDESTARIIAENEHNKYRDLCSHEPNWDEPEIENFDDIIYIIVSCKKCGCRGTFDYGPPDHLLHNIMNEQIDW